MSHNPLQFSQNVVCSIQTSQLHNLGTWKNLPSFANSIIYAAGVGKGLKKKCLFLIWKEFIFSIFEEIHMLMK